MAIAIFPSLEGESVEDVSIHLAEKWRIGQKELNNGVILVVFVKERKLRLEVGYGLEPVIPDAIAGGIVRDVIMPRFREGKYAAGLEGAVDAVYGRVQGATSGPPPRRGAPVRQSLPILGFLVLLGVVAVILGMETFRSRRFVERQSFTGGRHGWSGPVISPWGWGGGGGSSGGGGEDTFTGGGGEFGGGGASGEW